jgi:phytoene dehydrogenase-like protein
VDYSQIDSQLAPQGKGLGVICTFDYLSDWENLSKEEYKTKKEEVARILTERLNKVIPGIKDEIEYCEVATPKTIKRYTLNPGGTAYGFAQIPKQAGRKRIRQKSPIDNLYFASAWTFPGGGFSGAIRSGYWCAEEILDRKGTK